MYGQDGESVADEFLIIAEGKIPLLLISKNRFVTLKLFGSTTLLARTALGCNRVL